jgi:hypothetical protein
MLLGGCATQTFSFQSFLPTESVNLLLANDMGREGGSDQAKVAATTQ